MLNCIEPGYILSYGQNYGRKKGFIMQPKRQTDLECAGSLTPELEGNAHSALHENRRKSPPKSAQTAKKQGEVNTHE